MSGQRTLSLIGSFIATIALASAAQGAFLATGTYKLLNHPDGSSQPPRYGARFDELKNLTSDTDVFTMDFEHASSNMQLQLGTTTIRIVGTSFGGVDTGTGYAPVSDPVRGAYTGVYTIDFTYTIGNGTVPGDDDKWNNAASNTNFGTITGPNGYKVNLTNMFMGEYGFRFGDEDNDAGHRNHPGISGWGWMSYVNGSTVTHVDSTDWLFTAQLIPAPGASALLGIGGLLMLRRSRR